jgi:predicted dehydrogenase
MHRPFRVAILGTGFIGPVHIEALRRAGQQVVGILGSTPEKSRQAAERHGIPRGYASLDEVLRDGEVDSVHITTPNRFHFEQAAACLRAGKHVMCEKPLATTSSESAELVKIAADSGRAAGVAYNIRFYPLCHEAAARVSRGDYGNLLTVQGSYVQDWLLKATDFNWRVLADEGGELRALADIGTHWLDLVQFITGQTIVAVLADLHTVHPVRFRPPQGSIETFSGKGVASAGVAENSGVAGVGVAGGRAANPGEGASIAVGGSADHSHREIQSVPITTDDGGAVLLRFASGARGVLWVSQTTAGRKNCVRFEIGCTSGALAWNSESPNELWIGHRDGPNEQLIRDPALLAPAARDIANYPGGHNEGFPDTFKQLFRTFYGSIAAEEVGRGFPDPHVGRGFPDPHVGRGFPDPHVGRGSPDPAPVSARSGDLRRTSDPAPVSARSGDLRRTSDSTPVSARSGDLRRTSDPAPYPTFAAGHREILLCEAILASHREQRWVEVAT